MITVQEADLLIQNHLPKWGTETLSVETLSSHILSEDILADRNYPPFDRVMMDGIAVSWKAFDKGLREFQVQGICAAGAPALTLKNESSCFEVMTGAPLPHGTDLIIPYEHLEIKNGSAQVVEDLPRTQFENIHAEGSDCKKNELMLKAGSRFNGPHWGIAASLGYGSVSAARMPKVLIVSTGDELVEVAKTPLDHQIRRSNAYALKASLLHFGYTDVVLDHLKDEPKEISDHFQKNTEHFDLMIYSGGVSKGKFDYLPQVWADHGVTKYFHGISQRPGKPLFFGVDEIHKTAVIGLPGNPVSSLVCLHRYFLNDREMFAELTEDITFKKEMTFFVPVRIEFSKAGVLKAHPLQIKNSGEFTALAGSDGFLELPKEPTHFKKGEAFKFIPWGRL